MIPSEVADLRDIFMTEFAMSADDAMDVAWSLYRKGWRKEVTE